MIGALIGAGTSLLGGLLGKKSAEKQAKQNIKIQKQFAQEGIQWKVKDAEKAGVHPLYALGAQTHSFSPVSVGDPLPGAIADMGQGIGRAVESGMSSPGRNQRVLETLTVQRAELENTKLAAEIALMRQPGQPPPTSMAAPVLPGQGVELSPAPQTVANPAIPSTDYAVNPELSYSRTPTGYTPVPSDNYKKLTEDNVMLETGWAARHVGGPMMGNREHTVPPPSSWLPFGADSWYFHAPTMQWRPWNSNLREFVKNSNLPYRSN